MTRTGWLCSSRFLRSCEPEARSPDHRKAWLIQPKRISPFLSRISPSQSGKSTPLVQVLDFAQRYTASIRWEDFDLARADLQATNAFMDANEAEDKGVRLVLSKGGI